MSFALTHDILFNDSKTKYMIFKRSESVNTAPLYFKNTINNSLPIQISLEKRGVKSIWSCLNSDNCVVKTISQLATKLPRSVFGHNYIYFSYYKYSIMSHQWYESYNSVHHSIMDYISRNCTDHNYGIMIRDLCHYRDSWDPHVLTATEIVQLIEYLCTI